MTQHRQAVATAPDARLVKACACGTQPDLTMLHVIAMRTFKATPHDDAIEPPHESSGSCLPSTALWHVTEPCAVKRAVEIYARNTRAVKHEACTEGTWWL